jgi:hypothetical protein
MKPVFQKTSRQEIQPSIAETDSTPIDTTQRHDDVAEWAEVDEIAYDPTQE